MFTVNKAW